MTMRTVLTWSRLGTLGSALVLLASGCGAGGDSSATVPQVVVTTGVLGDVVQNLVGDQADVTVIMAPGTDPHEVSPSARQVAAMRDADLLVINGLGLEVGLLDTIEAAQREGTEVVVATDGAEVRGDDPHFFTDPVLVRAAAAHLADVLVDRVRQLDTEGFRARVATYLDALDALDAEVQSTLDVIPAERRVLVTNHESFGYFAARYDFTILGAVIPSGSPLAEPSAKSMQALADLIEAVGVPAIFTETSSPARLAEALAAEGSDTQVVELYTESLGPADSDGATYLEMMQTNATRIATALS